MNAEGDKPNEAAWRTKATSFAVVAVLGLLFLYSAGFFNKFSFNIFRQDSTKRATIASKSDDRKSEQAPVQSPAFAFNSPYFIMARNSYDAGDYRKAVDLFELTIIDMKEDRNTWLMYGNSLFALGRYDEARKCYEESMQSRKLRGISLFQLAATFALQGEGSLALQSLHQAVECGYSPELPLAEHPDFEILRERNEFISLVMALEKKNSSAQ